MILTNQAGYVFTKNILFEHKTHLFWYFGFRQLNLFWGCKIFNLMTTLSPPFEKLSGVKPQLMNRHFFITNVSAWHSFSNVYLPFFWNGFMTDNIIITGVKYRSQECMGGILSQFSNQGTYLTALYLHQQCLSLYEWSLYLKHTQGCFCAVRHVLPSISLISVVRQVVITQRCEAGFWIIFSCVFYFQLFLFSIRFILDLVAFSYLNKAVL